MIVFVVSLAVFFPGISNPTLGLMILIASAIYTVWLRPDEIRRPGVRREASHCHRLPEEFTQPSPRAGRHR
jgi:hypothetical protein